MPASFIASHLRICRKNHKIVEMVRYFFNHLTNCNNKTVAIITKYWKEIAKLFFAGDKAKHGADGVDGGATIGNKGFVFIMQNTQFR